MFSQLETTDMNLEFGMDYNSRVACALEVGERYMSVITIEAHGLVHQTMGRDSFLRTYYRDILQEEFVMLCKFLKIALAKSDNEAAAIQTLMKGFEMKLAELKGKTMDELVSMYNEAAKANGSKEVTKFKSLEAGRIEVVKISKAKAPKTAADKAATGGGAEGRKRVGVGKRAKELLLEGKSTQEVFDAIKAEFPDNSTTKPCIAYYKNALVKEGLLAGGRSKKSDADAPAKPAKGSKKSKKDAE
jgi:hypothetical protein